MVQLRFLLPYLKYAKFLPYLYFLYKDTYYKNAKLYEIYLELGPYGSPGERWLYAGLIGYKAAPSPISEVPEKEINRSS